MSIPSRAEAFKMGFALELARRGLTPSMMEHSLNKQAGWVLPAVAGAGRFAGSLSPLARMALGLWLVAPVVGGGMLGYSAGRATGPEKPDIDALKEEERVNIARRALNDLKRQQAVL